ncbi:hypothetical protein D3C73_937940 [compost metagenome]
MGDHCRSEDAAAVDDAHQVDGEHVFPNRLRAENAAAGLYAGIVHQHMDAAEALDDGAFEGCDLIRLRHVGADRRDVMLAAFGKCRHFATGFDELFPLQIDKHDG